MTATDHDRVRRVRLVTDSSACLPAHEIEAHGIAIVPTVLVWNGEELHDGVDITNEAFWKRLATDPTLPTTSSTSPNAYAAEFAKAHAAGMDVLCATIPRRISAMTEVAEMAARDFNSPPEVRVIQTGAATMAHGFPVLLGARAASAGADLPTVERTVAQAADDSGIVALLGSLEYLARGGRVPWVVARVADALPSTPMFGMRHGRIRFRAAFGSRARALRALVRHVRRRRGVRATWAWPSTTRPPWMRRISSPNRSGGKWRRTISTSPDSRQSWARTSARTWSGWRTARARPEALPTLVGVADGDGAAARA